MDAFFISTAIVALAEMGDKTQLLAFMLAARYRKTTPIILGILVATLANHGVAGALGEWLSTLFSGETLRWTLGASFILMAIWILIPDKLDDKQGSLTYFGIFGTTLILFFLAEMGDKTQIATIALAAQYQNVVAVVTGTTLGMMIANVPAVIFGEKITKRIPLNVVHGMAALVFAILGVVTIVGAITL